MYKSGDLGRFLPDGTVEYLGRNDHQVKVRGFRIELGEIETHLRRHPKVKEALVVTTDDKGGEKRLVAYVAHGALAPSGEELRAHLRASLPDYMAPGTYVVLENMPLTPNGKIDRKALPSPEFTAHIAKDYEAPHGEIENALAAIWQELLHVEQVSRHDNFFALGGHSLLAVRLATRIQSSMQCSIPLRDLFVSASLRTLAEHIATLQRSKQLAGDAPQIDAGERETILI
jgi:acyl carrier protein